MGDNFLKRQTSNFKKGRDLAAAEFSKPTLFARPEVLNTVYSAVPIDGCEFQVAEQLLVIASEHGEKAVLARGHQAVGCIEGDGAKSLLAALGETGSAGMAKVQITEVSGLSRVGKAIIVNQEQ
jgi:hypothetical protein